MITILLIKKIISLFIIVLAGALLVRFKVFSASESRTLSKCSLYLLAPCMILTAFQVDYSPEVTSGLALAAGASVIIQVLLVLVASLLDEAMSPSGAMCRDAACWFYIANEGLSLLENLGLMGVPYPERLRALLGQQLEAGGHSHGDDA